jgi:hypothetical protein
MSLKTYVEVGFWILTAVTMKNTVFWAVTSCSSVKAQHFRAMHRFHLQAQRVTQARNQQEAVGKQSELNMENQA